MSGCATDSGIQPGEHVRVYVSMPLRGPEAANGQDVMEGARLALADTGGGVGKLTVDAVYLDDTSGGGRAARWSAAIAAGNARRAAEDSTAIAYLGDFDSAATRYSLPVTNSADLLQVSPASGAVDLVQPFLGAGGQVPEEVQPTGDRTFGRVIPSDEVQAQAGAVWARRLGARRPAVSSGRTAYDETVASAFKEEARALGLHPVSRSEPVAASDLLFAAIEGTELSQRAGALRAVPRVIGTDALLDGRLPASPRSAATDLRITSAAQDPVQLPAAGRRFAGAFRDRYHRGPGRYAAYGYEAMSLVLDSIRRAGDSGDDRSSVTDAFFDTADRHSVLGTYSIDEVGDTTLDRLAGYRIASGRPVFDTALATP